MGHDSFILSNFLRTNRRMDELSGLLNLFGYNLTTLPDLPPNVQRLWCTNNYLRELCPLPCSLISLRCEYNFLTCLPPLPDTLETLMCSENQLFSLPKLPKSLLCLMCTNNPIGELPPLPTNLDTLECSENLLVSLPKLPLSLRTLICQKNELTLLPSLPDGLEELSCEENSLTCLPTLPDSLVSLLCDFNELTILPNLPHGLIALHCGYNHFQTLPFLPVTLRQIDLRGNDLAEPFHTLYHTHALEKRNIPQFVAEVNRVLLERERKTKIRAMGRNIRHLCAISESLPLSNDVLVRIGTSLSGALGASCRDQMEQLQREHGT